MLLCFNPLNVAYMAAHTSDVFIDKKTFSYSCLSAGQKKLMGKRDCNLSANCV